MNHVRRQTGMARGDGGEQPPDFAHGHFRIGFIFECGDGPAIFLGAHHARNSIHAPAAPPAGGGILSAIGDPVS